MPDIKLTPERVVCDRHAQPLSRTWDRKLPYLMLAKEMLDALMADPKFMREAQENVENVNPALDRKPICCRLEPTVLLRCYRTAARKSDGIFGTKAVCQICGQRKTGDTYAVSHPLTALRIDYDHVCFECVVFRMRGYDDA